MCGRRWNRRGSGVCIWRSCANGTEAHLSAVAQPSGLSHAQWRVIVPAPLALWKQGPQGKNVSKASMVLFRNRVFAISNKGIYRIVVSLGFLVQYSQGREFCNQRVIDIFSYQLRTEALSIKSSKIKGRGLRQLMLFPCWFTFRSLKVIYYPGKQMLRRV